ncbi:hypothetical protein L7F22_069057 [Adiantum nelumboides]|nr:hypothetical protein [Adiantum nelumboides]
MQLSTACPLLFLKRRQGQTGLLFCGVGNLRTQLEEPEVISAFYGWTTMLVSGAAYIDGLQPIDGVGRSSQASSLLRIPPVMDNKPQYANANRGSKVRSSFANPGTFRPEVPPDEGEHMRRQSLQRAESMGFPQDIQSNLDDTDLQSFRTSR